MVLVGVQPSLMQVPPTWTRSTTALRRPARASAPASGPPVGPVDTSPDVRVGVSALPSGGSRDGDVGSGQGTAADGLASDARGALSDRRPRAPRAATREHGRPAGCAATGEGTEPANPVWRSRGDRKSVV